MDPYKRVEILEDELCEAASIDIIRRACEAAFNVPGMSCDILETERGPSTENLDKIKSLNGTIFVRFVNETLTVTDSDGEESSLYREPCKKKPKVHVQKPIYHSSPIKAAESIVTGSQNPVAASLSVATVLRMGQRVLVE
mgnify:CR=1 FL=1